MKQYLPWLVGVALVLLLVRKRQVQQTVVGDISSTVTQDGGTKDALSSFVGNATEFLGAQQTLKDLARNAKVSGCDANGCTLAISYKSAPGNGIFEFGGVPQSLVKLYGIPNA